MAGLVSSFSSSTNIAFLVMTVFSFITVTEGICLSCNTGQVCCKNKCVDGSSCVGYPCFNHQDCSSNESCCFPSKKYSKQCVSGSSCLGKYCVTSYTGCARGEWCCNRECRTSCLGQTCIGDYDCSFNQTCCESQCVQGKNCQGKHCSSDYRCARGESCCNSKCKRGFSCIGESCSTTYDCRAIEGERCCKGKCSKHDCVNRVKYIAPAVGLGVFTIFTTICIIYTILRRRRLRRLMETNITTTATTRVDGTGVLTEQITTNINSAPITQSNPQYQSEGSPSDQPAEQPPPYTETPTGEPGGIYSHQSDTFAAAPCKTAGVA